jgi:hypothetical protein
VPCEAAEEFGVFGHAAHVNLKEGKAILERGELLKELFLSEILFRETASVFAVSVYKTFHDDAPLCWVGSCIYTTQNVIVAFRSCSEAAACLQPPRRPSNLAITRRPRPV